MKTITKADMVKEEDRKIELELLAKHAIVLSKLAELISSIDFK